MAAFALARYRFPFSRLLGLYLALGIMIPIRIGTVSILRLMVELGLTNTQLGLILVYTAASLPLWAAEAAYRQHGLRAAAKVSGRDPERTAQLLNLRPDPIVATPAVTSFLGA